MTFINIRCESNFSPSEGSDKQKGLIEVKVDGDLSCVPQVYRMTLHLFGGKTPSS